MKPNQTLYAAFTVDGEIMGTAESLLIFEEKRWLIEEMKAWGIKIESNTIKKIRIILEKE